MPDSFDALDADRAPGTPAKNCMETCCKTFVDNKSKKVNADDIQMR